MQFRSQIWLGSMIRVVSVMLVLSVFTNVLHAQVFVQGNSNVQMELRLVPTSVIVTPANLTAAEGSGGIQYTAMAKYQYDGLTTEIPDKDVTNDPLTVWSTGDVSVAIVNTLGVVTPVSDLNTGSAPVLIIASYGGVSGQTTLNVTGVVVVPPPSGGGGGGGGGGGSAGLYHPPDNGGGEQPSGGENNPPGGGEQPASGGENNPPGGGEQPPAGEPPVGGQVITNNEGQAPVENFGLIANTTTVLPMERPVAPEETITEQELFPPQENLEKTGVTRAFVVEMIAKKLRVAELRKATLDKCYADLANCTNIFRMFSNYDGISLNPGALKLFPDIAGLPEEDSINKMALLAVVNGYYALEDSPFLPNRPISRVETLKVLSTVLANFEKSKADYVAPDFDYNSLFYQEIYAASLLAKLQQQRSLVGFMKVPAWKVVRVAKALTDETIELIKAQKTPFADVRPDLYDAHWYYPIVYNKLCGLGLLTCKEGDLVNPDQSPTTDEIDQYISKFDKYFKDQQLDKSVVADDDDDGILNLDENLVYLTNPKSRDTDDDQLGDGDELIKYNTDPNKLDTDFDGLSDGNEVIKYKTDPNLYDTDGDGASDAIEIEQGSDPLDKNSKPDDKNANAIADSWELKYNIQVENGSQDTDGDGLPDVMEYTYGTNPTVADSDRDGFTDGEEILEVQSDPNDSASPGDARNLPVAITNLQYGQTIAESTPLIKGVGPASIADQTVKIQLLLRNEFGGELLLGDTVTDAKGRFVFIPTIEIKDGTYFLLARSINGGEVKLSKPLKIKIDSTLQVETAKPEKLENSPITEDVIVKKLVLKVDTRDGQPVLYGTLSEFGSRVNVTWQSLLVSSALIADATDGSFSVKAPKLDSGRHTVYIQTIRKRDNAVGKTLKITFDLGVKPGEQMKSAAEGGGAAILSGFSDFVSKQSWPFWALTVLVTLLILGGVYYWKLDEDDRKEESKKK